jgi:uncharacterized protein
MSVVEHLLSRIARGGRLTDLRVGLHWTIAVDEAEGGRTAGLASTQMDFCCEHGVPAVREAGAVTGRYTHEIADWALSTSPTERSIGFAAMNALLPVDEQRCQVLNAESLILEHGRDKHVAIVGHFPFVPKVREIAARCSVLELNPQDGDLPASDAPRVIPDADVVAITGMSLVNGTFEDLAEFCRPEAFVLLLGASTPLVPLFFDYGVDAISGTVIDDIDQAVLSVSQGANFRQVRGKRLLTMLRQ